MNMLRIRMFATLLVMVTNTAVWSQGPDKFGPSGIFSYVAPYEEEKGKYALHPMVTSTEQMTTKFPKNANIDGVILLLYWSILNPRKGQYAFESLDTALEYWQARGKHVGLAVATVGWPTRMAKQFGGEIVSATPSWVMKEVKTFANDTQIFDHQQARAGTWDFPLYWDPMFVGHSAQLIRELGKRYGKHPAVSFVRIATGVLGEDQPSTSKKLETGIPGFSSERWLNYSRQIAEQYRKAFPAKPLEFDMVRIGWFVARGSDRDKILVQEFVRYLAQNDIVLGYNGLRDESDDVLRNPKYADVHIFQMLRDHRTKFGVPASLEMYGPPQGQKMEGTERILTLIESVRPIRLVVFGQAVPVLNMAEGKLDPAVDTPGWQYFELKFGAEAVNQARRNMDMLKKAKRTLWNYQ